MGTLLYQRELGVAGTVREMPKPIRISEPVPIPKLISIPEQIPEPTSEPISESIPETDLGPTIRNRFEKTSSLAGIDFDQHLNK